MYELVNNIWNIKRKIVLPFTHTEILSKVCTLGEFVDPE